MPSMAQDADLARGSPSTSASPRSLTFLDLPRETQQDIFALCNQGDLICLSLVSRHFRELAAAPLYRNFHIVFPDEDDPAFDSPIDGLAGGLDTFVTSDYDYGKHLRDLSLDTLSAGDKAETAYKSYLYHLSCGKFMNTLLLLTLRKARSLESFKWNIRVELNRQVYRTLHHIATLNNLHIRLQAGPSLYETPPPLPFVQPPSPSSVSTPTVTYLADASIPGGPPPPPPAFNIPAPASLFYTPNVIPSLPPPAPPKPPIRAKPHKKASTANEPPTLSGFRNLKRVAILDIDSLDMVAEVKACVKNSASTLTKLKLSFSDCLGAQARKPAPEVDPDASDLEDDFQPAPPTSTNPYADDATGPGKVFRAQEERKAQEMVLGRIFDVEQTALKKPLRKSREKDRDSVSEEVISNAGKAFIHALKVVSTKLAKDLNGTAEPSVIKQEILDVIEAAARKYVASEEKLSVTEDKASDDSSSTVKASPSSENEQQQEATPDLPASQKNEGESPGTPTNVETSKEKISSTDLTPEDISIEEPEEQLVVESQEGSTKDTPISTPANEPEASTEQHVVPASAISEALESNADKPTALPIGTADFLAGQVSVLRGLSEDLLSWQRRIDELDRELLQLRDEPLHGERDQQILAADQQMENVRQHVDEIREKIRAMQAQWDKQGIELPRALANESEALTKRASAYARSTRGLALQSLSIYLMPVKASVLSRAIDLRALRRLTLLNVGPQAPIWALLTKENKVQPLPLRKIFTDNVSIVFLNFVSQMEEIHELFMLERDAKYKPQSFAPPTATNIEQIRRLVLRKHLPRLQRLMIKNQSTNSWDFDQKTMLMVCRRGTELQELAISMGIRTMHVFLQNLSGLVKLRALHVIQLKNDDTCVWVMRETKKFLIDNISHHPELKIEWISVDDDDRVDRLVRPSDRPKPTAADDKEKRRRKKKAKDTKGKQKAAASSTPGSANGSGSSSAALTGGAGVLLAPSDLFPVLPLLDGLDSANDGSTDSEDEDEDDEDDEDNGCLKTMSAHFYDVWGVRIFKKQIVAGRL